MKSRLIVAAIGVPLLYLVLLSDHANNLAIALLLAVACGIAALELTQMLRPLAPYVPATFAAIVLSPLLAWQLGEVGIVLAMLASIPLLMVFQGLSVPRDEPLPAILATLMPVLAPLAAGYAVARWTGLSARPLAVLLRYVLFPVLLFTGLQERLPFHVFLLVAATGAAMTLVGLALVRNAHRFLKPQVDSSAAMVNIACFAAPVLALAWAANGIGSARGRFPAESSKCWRLAVR